MRRREFLSGTAAALVLASAGLHWGCADSAETRTYGSTTLRRRKAASAGPNVLVLSLDDQNDWLGFLNNHPGTRTPNLDALAAESTVFTHAYTTAPMCNPARTAIFFGQPPHRSQVYDHGDESDAALERFLPEHASLADHFWSAGYETLLSGKVASGMQERCGSAADRVERSAEDDWVSPYDSRPLGPRGGPRGANIDFGPSGRPLDEEPDVITARWAADHLEHARTPFVLCYGTIRPHTPWRIPQEFLAQHPIEDVVVPEVRPGDLDDLSDYVRDDILTKQRQFGILRDSGLWEEAVQAYQASTTLADHCIGIVLDALAASPHADDTVVVVFSDHGFHLGEKLHLHKFTLWERATRVPFLLRAPGTLEPGSFDIPVSTLDLGPTVAELCDVEIKGPHEGASLVPLIRDPSRADERPPVTTWLEGNHAVRRSQWRYIRYRTGDTELYDHAADPNEFTNLAGRPEHRSVEAELGAFLPAA